MPIRGVILDNDNTLYVEPENARAVHEQAAIQAVRAHGIEGSDQKIRGFFKESRERYGVSLDIFTHEHGVDPVSLRGQYYKTLIQQVRGQDFFNPEEALRAELSILRLQGINLYIATHGNDDWTDFTLRQNRIDHLFNRNAVRICRNGSEELPGKNRGPQMYQKVLDIAGVDPSITKNRGTGFAMVEDTPENLKYAKELGMMTILLGQGRSREELAAHPYVDVVLKNRHDLANLILESNAVHETLISRISAFREANSDHEAGRNFARLPRANGNPTILEVNKKGRFSDFPMP